ncbi:MAG: hydrogenase nickel incorporation protein HypB [Bacillota bacterium]|nr:hydrogenase nickel incorporation protein HypB [Bacillota bacterium]
MKDVKVIEIHESVFAQNEKQADLIRKKLWEQGTYFINVMSSPGSGKTTFLTEIINMLKQKISIGLMNVDIESDLDARRISEKTGIPSLQIHNGGLCHIDADMVSRALIEYDTKDMDLLILENIGNLVCPAEFDTGAHKNIMLYSVPEGDDKPLKYPLMFQVCDIVLINKVDTLPFFNFDLELAIQRIHSLNPNAVVIPISARTKEGLESFITWLKEHMEGEKHEAY